MFNFEKKNILIIRVTSALLSNPFLYNIQLSKGSFYKNYSEDTQDCSVQFAKMSGKLVKNC